MNPTQSSIQYRDEPPEAVPQPARDHGRRIDALRRRLAERPGLALAGAYMGGKRAAIIMQNTAIGVTINSLVTLIQYYNIPLPMLISYRGEVGEKVACQVEMAVHTKALLSQLLIPTYHFHQAADADELDGILNHSFMAKKPVAVLMDAGFWKGAA